MKALIAIFLLFLLLTLLFLFISQKVHYTGEFIKISDESKPRDTKWKVIARVEILNGKIVKINS